MGYDWEVSYGVAKEYAVLGWQVACYGFDGFGVYLSRAAYGFYVMLVGEVEEEYVVCLAVDAFSYCVWLVCDEGCEYAEVSHACDYVVPVGFA